MLIALFCAYALLFLLWQFAAIDLRRAVKAKEEWRGQAIEADKSCKFLGKRNAWLMDIIKKNNTRHTQVLDELEDAELAKEEVEKELADVELALAFAQERDAAQGRAIDFWVEQFDECVKDWCAERQESDRLRKHRGELVERVSRLNVRNDSIGTLLEVPLDDRDYPGVLTDQVRVLVEDLQATKGLLDVASEEIAALVAARDEATALLVKSQEEAADLAKDREELINRRDADNAEICAVLDAIQEKAHLGVGVRLYAISKGVALTVSSGVNTIASTIDDMKSANEHASTHITKLTAERDNLKEIVEQYTHGERVAPGKPLHMKRRREIKKGAVKRATKGFTPRVGDPMPWHDDSVRKRRR